MRFTVIVIFSRWFGSCTIGYKWHLTQRREYALFNLEMEKVIGSPILRAVSAGRIFTTFPTIMLAYLMLNEPDERKRLYCVYPLPLVSGNIIL